MISASGILYDLWIIGFRKGEGTRCFFTLFWSWRCISLRRRNFPMIAIMSNGFLVFVERTKFLKVKGYLICSSFSNLLGKG